MCHVQNISLRMQCETHNVVDSSAVASIESPWVLEVINCTVSVSIKTTSLFFKLKIVDKIKVVLHSEAFIGSNSTVAFSIRCTF